MKTVRRSITVCLLTATLSFSTGCATLAHRTHVGKDGQTSRWCDGSGDGACPWLLGDAAWLLAFIVPGVIGFCVDFATGDWKHPA